MKNEDLLSEDNRQMILDIQQAQEREELFSILKDLDYTINAKVISCQRLINDELVDGMPYILEEKKQAKQRFDELIDKYGREQFYKDLDSEDFRVREYHRSGKSAGCGEDYINNNY